MSPRQGERLAISGPSSLNEDFDDDDGVDYVQFHPHTRALMRYQIPRTHVANDACPHYPSGRFGDVLERL